MLTPLSWLRDFADIPTDARLVADTLDSLGLMVDEIKTIGAGLEAVVVARVLQIREIKGADKIRLIDVDPGDGNAIEIVCGAKNFVEGDLVPLAPVGAVLPGGFEIGFRKLKGVTSNGMLCSGTELGIGADSSGLMILPTNLKPGTPILEALQMQSDIVFDLAIETNRPDALCMAGVARDLAAKFKIPFVLPLPAAPKKLPEAPGVSVEVVDTDLCTRFTATVLRGVQILESTSLVVSRLALAGMRSINNVVDASNYVMLELGQPTHAYDLQTLGGAGFRVRAGRAGEKIETLDRVVREIPTAGRHCVIADANDRLVGLAGVMGGADTEISETTTSTVLEAAHFSSFAISKTSRHFALRSEASARFERGVDPNGMQLAISRFVEMLGGVDQVGDTVDVTTGSEVARKTFIRTRRVNALLGTQLESTEIAECLAPLGYATRRVDDDRFDVTIPTYRPDSTEEIDVVEEVARHFGYANIEPTVRFSPNVGKLNGEQLFLRKLKTTLVGSGYQEIISAALLAPNDHAHAGITDDTKLLNLINPLARDESVLRASLLPSMLKAVQFNVRQRNSQIAFFEVGQVFAKPTDGIGVAAANLVDEQTRVGVIVCEPSGNVRGTTALSGQTAAQNAARVAHEIAEFARLDSWTISTSDVQPGMHPTRTAILLDKNGVQFGVAGEIDPSVLESFGINERVAFAEIYLHKLMAAPTRSETITETSKYPSSDIDLAFVVPFANTAYAVQHALQVSGGELLEDLYQLSVFRDERMGDSARSIAFRLRFSAIDRTLTDVEVGAARTRCIDAVMSSLAGVTLRG